MAINLPDITQRVRFDVTDADRASSSISSALSGAASSLGNVASTVGRDIGEVFKTGAILAAGLGTAIIATGVSYNTLEQQSRAAFTAILGSAEEANRLMNDLAAFATESPFPRQAFIEAAQSLTAMGIAADDVIPILGAVQDAVAAMGGGAQQIEEIVGVFGKISAQGKITGEDINSLSALGINALQLLADAAGVSADEMRTSISDGAIDAEFAITALTEGIEGKFGGAAEGVKQTWIGAVDRIKGAFRDLSSAIVEPFISTTGGGAAVTWANDIADSIRNVIKNVVPEIQGVLTDIVGIMDKVIGTITDGLNNLDGSAIANAFNTIKDAISGIEPFVIGVGASFASMAARGIPFIGQFVPAISLVTGALGGLLFSSEQGRDAVTNFGKGLLDVASSVAPAFNEAISVLGTAVGEIAQVLGPVLLDVLSALAPAVAEIATIFGQLLADVGPELATSVGAIAVAFAELVAAIGPDLAQALAAVAEAAAAIIGTGLDLLVPVLEGIASSADVLTPILIALGGAFAAFKIGSFVSDAVSFTQGLFGIGEAATGAASGLTEGASAAEGFGGGMLGAVAPIALVAGGMVALGTGLGHVFGAFKESETVEQFGARLAALPTAKASTEMQDFASKLKDLEHNIGPNISATERHAAVLDAFTKVAETDVQAAIQLRDEWKQHPAVLDRMGISIKDVNKILGDILGPMGETQRVAIESRAAMTGYGQAFSDAFGIALQGEEAQNRFVQSTESLNAALLASAGNFDRQSEAGQNARSAIVGQAAAAGELFAVLGGQGVSQADAAQIAMQGFVTSVIDAGVAGGATKEQMIGLVEEILQIPPELRFFINSNTAPETALMKILAAEIAGVSTEKLITITSNADTEANAMTALDLVIDGIPAQKVADIVTNAASKQTEFLALDAVRGGIPAQTIADIVTNATSKKEEMAAFDAIARGVDPEVVSNVLLNGGPEAVAKLNELTGNMNALDQKTATASVFINDQGATSVLTDMLAKLAGWDGATGTADAYLNDLSGPALTEMLAKLAGWDGSTGTADAYLNDLSGPALTDMTAKLLGWDSSSGTAEAYLTDLSGPEFIAITARMAGWDGLTGTADAFLADHSSDPMILMTARLLGWDGSTGTASAYLLDYASSGLADIVAWIAAANTSATATVNLVTSYTTVGAPPIIPTYAGVPTGYFAYPGAAHGGIAGGMPSVPLKAAGGMMLPPRPGGWIVNIAEAGEPEAVIPLGRSGTATADRRRLMKRLGMGIVGQPGVIPMARGGIAADVKLWNETAWNNAAKKAADEKKWNEAAWNNAAAATALPPTPPSWQVALAAKAAADAKAWNEASAAAAAQNAALQAALAQKRANEALWIATAAAAAQEAARQAEIQRLGDIQVWNNAAQNARVWNEAAWNAAAQNAAAWNTAAAQAREWIAAFQNAPTFDLGGALQPGLTMAVNKTGRPESVLGSRAEALLEDMLEKLENLANDRGGDTFNLTALDNADLARRVQDERNFRDRVRGR